MLSSVGSSCHPPHDIFDDLESFLYVLGHLVQVYEGPGIRRQTIENVFKRWESNDLTTLIHMKVAYVTVNTLEALPWWGKPCEKLLRDFQGIVSPIVRQKSAIRDSINLDDDEKLRRLEALARELGDPFEEVVGLFDTALREMEAEDRARDHVDIEPDVATNGRTVAQKLHPSDNRTARKRRAEETGQESDGAKRRHILEPKAKTQPRSKTKARHALAGAEPLRRSRRLNAR